MARWRVAKGQMQFTAEDLADLQRLAREGRFGPGDMVQPPGAADWLYASELPELKGAFRGPSPVDLDLDAPKKSGASPILIGLLLAAVAGVGWGIWSMTQKLPEAGDLELLGEKGLKLTEMLVTANAGAPVRDQPSDNASSVATAPKDSKVQLLGKRGPWYEVRTEAGAQGYMKVDEVIPAYFFADASTRQNHDPLYNPDRYVEVKGASWMQLPDQQRDNVTIFQFMLSNESKFDMTDLTLLATIKDARDRVLEKKEIPIEGRIPARSDVMVGTLAPDPKDREGVPRLMTDATFQELQAQEPDLALRWSAGIEVKMDTVDFEKANIDLLQVRAVPLEKN